MFYLATLDASFIISDQVLRQNLRISSVIYNSISELYGNLGKLFLLGKDRNNWHEKGLSDVILTSQMIMVLLRLPLALGHGANHLIYWKEHTLLPSLETFPPPGNFLIFLIYIELFLVLLGTFCSMDNPLPSSTISDTLDFSIKA